MISKAFGEEPTEVIDVTQGAPDRSFNYKLDRADIEEVGTETVVVYEFVPLDVGCKQLNDDLQAKLDLIEAFIETHPGTADVFAKTIETLNSLWCNPEELE